MSETIQFEAFPKIPRLRRGCIITEKIDGTNAQIIITPDGNIGAASRTRLITPLADNFGFARWVDDNREELLKLGPGRHFGEWWGSGIQRGYGLKEKRFSLFNATRWENVEELPSCVSVVPILYRGLFTTNAVEDCIDALKELGSQAAPGFMRPEGVIVWHAAARTLAKVMCENDDVAKGEAA